MPAETTVTVRDLRSHLSAYLQLLQEGHSIVVTVRGKPIARLLAINTIANQPRPFGFMKGQIRIASDFDETPPEVLAAIDADLFPPRQKKRAS